MRMQRLLPLVVLAAAGCTLDEVTIPAGDDQLVVEAVMRTDVVQQEILLHRSLRGRLVAGEPGARVVVRSSSAGEVVFTEVAPPDAPCYTVDPRYAESDSVQVRATCYRSPAGLGRLLVRPGDTLELTIETRRGEVARGRSLVPGGFALTGLPFSRERGMDPQPCSIPAGTRLPVRWTRSPGAWAYVAPARIEGLRAVLPDSIKVPEPLELQGVSVSAADTTIVLPSEFGVFERVTYDAELLRSLQGGLPRGVLVRLSVAAADRNYVNGVRGGSFNPSGRVRISSVVGDGVGVFGSLVPLRALIQVAPRESVPPCGA